jgi:ParB family chromosome partitioning protein
MSKKHDAVFDDVLSGLPTAKTTLEKKSIGAGRFLKRSTSIADRITGDTEEKTLRWIEPSDARMWERHNRDYALLNEDNCRDLIDGIKSQGRQEFPAIVRKISGAGTTFEVICGARRHFAISWLRANNYTQFKYLVEVRDLSDEEAFRLADIENRDRTDISDYERAVDYAEAIRLYYGGKQKAMAERLEVTEAWLSRYLNLAKLPDEIVSAFFQKTDIKELHARTLKPLILKPSDKAKVIVEAKAISAAQQDAKDGAGAPIEASVVVGRLKAALASSAGKKTRPLKIYKRAGETKGVTFSKKGRKMVLEFPEDLSRASLDEAVSDFMNEHFPEKLPIGKN